MYPTLFLVELVPAMLLGLAVGHFTRRNSRAIMAVIACLSSIILVGMLVFRLRGSVGDALLFYALAWLMLVVPALPSALFGLFLARVLQMLQRGQRA